VTPDAYAIGDAKVILQELLGYVKPLETKEWLQELDFYRKQYPLSYDSTKGLTPQHIIDEVYKLSKGRAIVSTDVGQNQMWSAQFYKVDYPDHWLSSGGAGTMGFGLPAAIGAQFGRPKDLVITIVGDGGFQMTQADLATASIHKLPIKIIIMDNKYLGMVRQWQELFFDNRLSGVDLKGSPDFVKIAEAHRMKAFHLMKSTQVRKTLEEALRYHDGPCLIHAEVIKENNVFPMIPAGKSAYHMIVEPPTKKAAQ